MSPRLLVGSERLAYAGVGAVLSAVALGGFAITILSWLLGDFGFGLFGLLVGLPALLVGYRMLFAAASGRRLYWWPGQRDYDRGAGR